LENVNPVDGQEDLSAFIIQGDMDAGAVAGFVEEFGRTVSIDKKGGTQLPFPKIIEGKT